MALNWMMNINQSSPQFQSLAVIRIQNIAGSLRVAHLHFPTVCLNNIQFYACASAAFWCTSSLRRMRCQVLNRYNFGLIYTTRCFNVLHLNFKLIHKIIGVISDGNIKFIDAAKLAKFVLRCRWIDVSSPTVSKCLEVVVGLTTGGKQQNQHY